MSGDWLQAKDVANLLCTVPSNLAQKGARTDLKSAIATKLGDSRRRTLYLRSDVERVRAIMNATRLKWGQACRVLSALKRGEVL